MRTLRRWRLMPCVRTDHTCSVFSTILRIYQIGKLTPVTIRRELIHSDQINKSEHGETDRHFFHETTPRLIYHLPRIQVILIR